VGFLGDILGFLGSAAGAILAGLWQAVLTLWSLLVQVATFLYQVIAFVANFIFGALRKLGFFVRDLWAHGIRRVFDALMGVVNRLFAWLRPYVERLIRFLKRLRDFYDRYYNTTIKPLLDLLQRIRRYLLLLRLLGIKQAQRLDQRLLRIETGLVRTFTTAQGFINSALSALNVLLDPRRAGRLIVAVVMGRRAAALFVRIATGKPLGYFFPTPFAPGGPQPPEHERACVLAHPEWNPPASALFNALVDSQLSTPVADVEQWPGLDVDALALLPFFDDAAYSFSASANTAARLYRHALEQLAEMSRHA